MEATATTVIYTLSLHDALPISDDAAGRVVDSRIAALDTDIIGHRSRGRSEEHTSELQSRLHLVCRLLLEKKKDVADTRVYESLNRVIDHLQVVDGKHMLASHVG